MNARKYHVSLLSVRRVSRICCLFEFQKKSIKELFSRERTMITLVLMSTPSSRIIWLDHLRVLACVLVIASHIVGQFFVSPPFALENETFACSSFYTVLVRVSIPLFFMISGALLLPVRESTGVFLKKRFSRVLLPFLLWSVFYTVFPWCYEWMTGDSFKTIFPLSRVTADLPAMGENLLLIPLKFGAGIHLWYLYVLIGLYLFAPIISPWVEKAGKMQFLYFLFLWSVSLFLPYIKLVFPHVLGQCPWNDYGTLHSFSGYLGYMVLGYFLRKYNNQCPFAKTAIWAIPCLVASFWFTLHFYRVSTMEVQASSGTYIGFANVNVAMMAVALFTLFQAVPQRNCGSATGAGERFLADFSKMSFGIYLVHFFLVGAIYNLFNSLHWLSFPSAVSIPMLTLATSLISYLVIRLLSFFPGSKCLIG